MMKALLKEGDINSALRVLEDGERNTDSRKNTIDNFYSKIYDYCFNEENHGDQYVAFIPDLIREREKRINQEIEAASKISAYEKEKVLSKYKTLNPNSKLPVSYSDFKNKHYNMVKTVNNYTKQMMVMKLVNAAVEEQDFRKIDNFFTYLLVTKEEEQIIKSIRANIEAYSKTFDPQRSPKSLSESKDPLRVLFKYFKKPTDDIDSLVQKYILIHPGLKQRIDKIRERKDYLYKSIKGAIKEKEAQFLADSGINDLQDLTFIEDFNNLNFDLTNEKSREALDKMLKQYQKLMESMTETEKASGLPAQEIFKARKIYEKDSSQNYNEILDQVNEDYEKLQNKNNLDIQEKLQILIDAGDIATAENQDFVDKFVQELNDGQLDEFKDIISRLRSQYHSALNTTNSVDQNITSSSTFTSVLNESIDNYYSNTSDATKPGHSKFINHANGDVLYVDDARMANDNQYFVKTVAELAKTEMMNHSWNKTITKTKEKQMLNGIMKSREFRKYYYLMRKYYYQRFQEDLYQGKIVIHRDNSIMYKMDRKSKLKLIKISPLENTSQPLKITSEYIEDMLDKVFAPPQFDIINFRRYYDRSEYDEIVKQYYTFTRGTNKSQKLDYLKHKLFGEKLQEQADRMLDQKLKTLYKNANISPGQEESMYELFKKILPQEIADESPFIRDEISLRKKLIDNRYKKDFDKLWNLYKQEKIENYESTKSFKADSSQSTNEYLTIDPVKLDNFGQSLYEIKNIMDTVDTKLTNPSEDHVAFETFDFIMHNEYSKYQSDIEKEIYGDDEYDKGYRNKYHMSEKFKDIFDYDHINIRKAMFLNKEANIRPLLNIAKDTKHAKPQQNNIDPDIEAISFERAGNRKKQLIKSHDLEYASIEKDKSMEYKNAEADRIVKEFVDKNENETKQNIRRLQKDYVPTEELKTHIVPSPRFDGPNDEEESESKDYGYKKIKDIQLSVKSNK